MTPRSMLLIVAALIVTGATVYFADSWLARERAALNATQPEQKEVEPAIKVLVAKKAMPAGQFVTNDLVRWQAWPKEAVPETYLVEGKHEVDAVIGSVVRRGFAPGEPINTGQIIAPGDRGFMAAVLNPGMRAVAVPVNAATAVAGFIFPGDKVDLLLSMDFVEGKGRSGGRKEKRFGTETLLTSVRVLAIDQRAADQENKPSVAKTVTLEVTPEQVEILSVAQQLGRISLALRSLARPGQSEPTTVPEVASAIQLATANGVPVADDLTEDTPDDESFVVPIPGGTYTFDSEASRLRRATLAVKEDGGPKIIELRGGSRKVRSAE